MGRLHFVLGLCVCSFVAVAPAPGSPQFLNRSLSVSGTVFAEGGGRISNAIVALCDEQGNCFGESRSSDAGEFSFASVKPGRYLLRTRAQGFADSELPIDLTQESQRGLSLALKALPQPGSAIPDRPSISTHELSMPETARDLMGSGLKKLYKEKNAQAGLNDFQAATAKAPSYYEAFYQSGMAYLTLQKEAEAEKEFRRSAELSQNKFGDADIALGTLLLKRGQERDGETYLRQGLALNPQSWPGQVELGKLELNRGHLELALAAAEKAESLAPLQPMVYRLLALVHMREKNYSALIVDLDSYIRLDPDSPAGVRAKELRAQVEKEVPQTAARTASGNK
jgi:tetratricopeptide (TPR) repeat protein